MQVSDIKGNLANVHESGINISSFKRMLHKQNHQYINKEAQLLHKIERKHRNSPAFSSNGAQLQFADKDLAQESYGM